MRAKLIPSRAICSKPRRRHRAGRRRRAKVPAPIGRADRDTRARRLSSDPPLQGHARRASHESAHYDPSGTFSNACHVAIVEVDVETGRVTIEKYLVAEDAGRIINPMIADGQVHGGVAQGIGNALLEEIVYDGTGNIQTATLADYTAADRARNSADRRCTIWRRRPRRRSPAPRGSAKAAPSARPPPSSTRSTTRFRRSASRSTKFRRRRSASARR